MVRCTMRLPDIDQGCRLPIWWGGKPPSRVRARAIDVATRDGFVSSEFPEFDEDSFDAQVLQRPGLTIVDFWAEWCVPCKQMTRLLGEIAGDLPEGVLVGKVDADHNRTLVERYGVRAIPTLLFFKGGEVVETRTGVDRKQVLKKAIEAHA